MPVIEYEQELDGGCNDFEDALFHTECCDKYIAICGFEFRDPESEPRYAPPEDMCIVCLSMTFCPRCGAELE